MLKTFRLLSLLLLVGSFASRPAFAQLAATPDSVGMSAEKLAGVTKLLNDRVADKTIAGAVGMVLRDGKLVYHVAVGNSDVEAAKPMAKDSLFRIASMTKPVTSVAVMMLVDEGKLKTSDPLSKYVPEFAQPKVISTSGAPYPAAKREITIHDLLTHTSGLGYAFFLTEPLAGLYREAKINPGPTQDPWDLATNVHRLAALPLAHDPGARFTYGMNTDVLGRVVEVVAGQPFDSFCRERIFEPLGMSDTHFFLPEEKVARLAAVYAPDPDKKIVRVTADPATVGRITYSASFPYRGPRKYVSGGGGLVSTPGDYAKFLQMLLNEGELKGQRILKPETVREMTKNQIGELSINNPLHGDKFGYGFGVASKQLPTGASAGAYSWGGLFHTFFWVDPQEKLVGVVMTQLFPFDHSTLWADYQARVYDAVVRK